MPILSVREILVVPYIVVVVSLDVRRVPLLQRFIADLFAGWPLQPLILLHYELLAEHFFSGQIQPVVFLLFSVRVTRCIFLVSSLDIVTLKYLFDGVVVN